MPTWLDRRRTRRRVVIEINGASYRLRNHRARTDTIRRATTPGTR